MHFINNTRKLLFRRCKSSRIDPRNFFVFSITQFQFYILESNTIASKRPLNINKWHCLWKEDANLECWSSGKVDLQQVRFLVDFTLSLYSSNFPNFFIVFVYYIYISFSYSWHLPGLRLKILKVKMILAFGGFK